MNTTKANRKGGKVSTKKRRTRKAPPVVFTMKLPVALYAVLARIASERGKTKKAVIIDGWLSHDREAFERYVSERNRTAYGKKS